MKIEATEFLPLARREALITKEVDGELLVYDVARDKAHCLNETAAAVWQLSDGRTSVKEISEQLAEGSRQKAEGSRQKAEGSRQTADGSRQTADGSRQTADGSRQTADGSRQTADGSRRMADGSRQKADGFSLSTQHSALSTSPQKAAGFSLSTQHSALSTPHQLTPDTQIIWLALDQLRRSHLLEEAAAVNEKTSWPAAITGLANMSRREAVRRIGLGAAIALPLVASMTAPTAVEAAVSCRAKCQPCSTPADCCGVCSSTSVPGCPTSTPRCT
jgi:hypothetical protein